MSSDPVRTSPNFDFQQLRFSAEISNGDKSCFLGVPHKLDKSAYAPKLVGFGQPHHGLSKTLSYVKSASLLNAYIGVEIRKFGENRVFGQFASMAKLLK